MKSNVERQSDILELLQKTGSQKVEKLAKTFNVSTVTIRKDLNVLEEKGYITRSYGYAVLRSRLMVELTVEDKETRYLDFKQQIGKCAANLLENNDRIILDSGTTTKEIVSHIGDLSLTVLTNGLDTAMALLRCPNVELRMTGGVLRKGAMSFSGVTADNAVLYNRFDKVFLGVDGFDIQKGITTFNEQEAQLNRLMCRAADKVVVVTDSSKFGQYSNFVICQTTQIDVLITDSHLQENYKRYLEKQGVQVIIV